MDRWFAAACCTLALLSGCADIQPPQDDAPVHTASGEVSVAQLSDGAWRATRTEIGITVFAAGEDLAASTVNGAVTINDEGSARARAMASLWAVGTSEEEARQRLDTLRFELAGPGVQAHIVSDAGWQQRGGALVIQLPTSQVGTLDVDVVSGAVTVDGLHVDDLQVATTAGAVDVVGQARDMTVHSTSGIIDLELAAKASGRWSVSTDAGGIELKVTESSQRGYDMEASAVAGRIEFDLTDTEVVSSQMGPSGGSHHERTRSYEARAVQTHVELRATAGQIIARS